MVKRLFAFVLLCVLWTPFCMSSAADSVSGKSPWSFRFSGFVASQLFYDTRQVVSGREGMMLFYPKPQDLDVNGEDINAVPSLNMLSISTRLAGAFTAPDVLGAKTSAYIEGDFTGSTNEGINMLRLRHAYIDLKWQHSEFLTGQFWHPMVIHEIMPGTRPLNMGAPFHPYARYVQARYSQYFGPVELLGVAAFQLDNKSFGPGGSSTEYLKHSTVPELNLQVRYQNGRLFFGAAYNLLVMRPRLLVTDALGARYKTSANVVSHAFTVFGKYEFPDYSLRLQAVRADNLGELSLLGGYIENPFDEGTKTYTYENFGCTTAWLDFGKSTGKWRPGIFLGYGINNDFGEKLPAAASVYGRGFEIENLWRVQPRISYYPAEKFGLFFEVEYTGVNYGEKQTETDGTFYYRSGSTVGNARFILSAIYTF